MGGKGLTIRQPLAAAIAFGGKDIENRSWQTHYRGPLAIHASREITPDDLDRMERQVRGGEKRSMWDWIKRGGKQYGYATDEHLLPCSHIVAIAMLVDCVKSSSSPWFQRNHFGWVLAGVVPIKPIEWKGDLSTWDCEFEYKPLKRIK